MSNTGSPKNELHVSADGINLSAPWRLAAYSREGPLTDEQVLDLANWFDLDPSDVRRLSRALNVVLDREWEVNSVPISLPAAKARGHERMSKALRDIVGAQARLTAGLAKLEGLSLEGHESSVAMWGIHDALRDCQRLLETVPAELEAIVASPEGILILEPTNKRKVADLRRDLILMAIFHLWSRSGRSLTYTTDTQTSERRGPLIEFVNAVVACVTDPPSSLSGETVVRGLRAFRDRNKAASVSMRFSDLDWDTWTAPVPSFSVRESPTARTDPPPPSTRSQGDDWISPVHTLERLDRPKRGERDGTPDREIHDAPDHKTEPAPPSGPGDADDR